MNKSQGTTSSMLDCNADETKRQDARLNKAYKALMADLSAPRKTSLLEAQRAWLKFRETNCAFYANPEGGTLATLDSSSCFLSATTSRAAELEKLKD